MSAPRFAAIAAVALSPPRSNLAQQAYVALKQQMHDFVLVPGDRFSEIELAQRLGMSRTPLREALFRLRNEGFLEVESKSGWSVKPLDFARIDELYELRVLVETHCVARLCASDLAGCDLSLLEPLKQAWLVAPSERLVEQVLVGEMDEAFHASLVRAAGNQELARVHSEVTERIRIVRRLDFTRVARIDATYVEHAKILRSIMRRQPEPSLMLLRSHIEQSRVEVRKITLAALHEAREHAQVKARQGDLTAALGVQCSA
jgi:DNA-binding GntR family transcriptional regulator